MLLGRLLGAWGTSGSFYNSGFYLYDATYTLVGETYGQIAFNKGNSALELNDVITSDELPQQYADSYPGDVSGTYSPVYVKHKFVSGSAWTLGSGAAADTWHVLSDSSVQMSKIGTDFSNTSRYWIAEANDGTLIRASALIKVIVTPA